MFNHVFLRGNLVRDVDLKAVKETHVANFTIASNRKFKRSNGEMGQETTYVDCEMWDSAAERFSEWCKKGDSVSIIGSLKTDTWKDDEGNSRSRLKVRVTSFERNRTARDFEGGSTSAETVPSDDGGENIPF